jgi:hypothetical protein
MVRRSLIGAVVMLAFVAGCHSAKHAGGSGSASRVTIRGTVVRSFDRPSYVSPDNAPPSSDVTAAGGEASYLAAHGCEPRFSTNVADLVAGAPVVVRNAKSDQVGASTLGAPSYDGQKLTCSFPFTVANVAASNMYNVVVGNRDPMSFTPSQVQSAVTLTFTS